MPQYQIIPTTTEINQIGSNTLEIHTFYNGDQLGKLIRAQITENNFAINGTPFKQGELAMTYVLYANPNELNFFINPNGDLNAVSFDNTFPASNYAVDSPTGMLTVTV